jgi:hypothetical protein
MMSHFKLAALAIAGALCVVSLPALAQDHGDSMMVISPGGKMAKMAMPDKAMMDKMMEHAIPMNDDMAILVWGAKTYMIKNEKMADGRMTFDVWGIRFDR